jgi:hypothetical protein
MEALMERSDHSLAAKLVLYLGALVVVAYAIATVGDVLYGSTSSAVAWVTALVLGFAGVVVAATLVERRSARQ